MPPRAGEVLCEVALTGAVHLALALCLGLGLELFGIDGGIPMHFLRPHPDARLEFIRSAAEIRRLFAPEDPSMLDVILIAVGTGCFVVAIAYAFACDRL